MTPIYILLTAAFAMFLAGVVWFLVWDHGRDRHTAHENCPN